ncbi:transferase [Gordonia sp. OPL2]|uniref:transferase n=1 Tax=Gordonia sp. OPL2 TaxID=2486274 RepID=UPI0016553C5E|nr:transferase [Gordonia sp. OPL2]ROZ83710.1 transferase [Gordonia sp. OPL2]
MSVCRACGFGRPVPVLELGAVPAADHFPPVSEPVSSAESSHPATMVLCGRCGLAQLADDDTVTQEPRGVEPRALVDQAAAALCDVEAAGLLRGTSVTEFGSPHGGTWIPQLEARGLTDVGRDHPGGADVVIDSMGIMHEPDQAAAFARRAAATAPDGVLLMQFHSLAAIVGQGQWNALRHGHFAYYSLPALVGLLRAAGMYAATAWRYDLYGGTVMVAATHRPCEPDATLAALIDAEQDMTDAAVVSGLQRAVDRHVRGLRGWLDDEAAAGRRVYAYGAASRAVAVFGLAQVDSSLIVGVADASPAKHGRRMPGCDVPIISPSELVAAQPDSVLLMVPDLLDEVRARFPEIGDRWRVDGAEEYPSREGTHG